MEIDEIGIIAALRMAGQRALASLSGPVDAVLLDGNHNYLTTPAVLAAATDDLPLFEIEAAPAVPAEPRVHVRIKADMTCAAVAGASVLAKTERDRLLVEMAPRFPRYGFAENKGYGTPEHVAALRRARSVARCTGAAGGCPARNRTCSASRRTCCSGRSG